MTSWENINPNPNPISKKLLENTNRPGQCHIHQTNDNLKIYTIKKYCKLKFPPYYDKTLILIPKIFKLAWINTPHRDVT